MSPLKVTNPIMVDSNANNLKNLSDQGFKRMLISMFEHLKEDRSVLQKNK